MVSSAFRFFGGTKIESGFHVTNRLRREWQAMGLYSMNRRSINVYKPVHEQVITNKDS